MCDRIGWHESGNEVSRLGADLTLTEKCLLHFAFVRDFHPTLGETLAKLTAEREAAREMESAYRRSTLRRR
jgi:hypothetical protein